MCLSCSRCRIWFAHDRPWPIRLTGRDLWIAFAMEGPIGTSIVDAMIRLVQEEDTAMYKDAGCNERQWRHLLPACFSVSLCNRIPAVEHHGQ